MSSPEKILVYFMVFETVLLLLLLPCPFLNVGDWLFSGFPYAVIVSLFSFSLRISREGEHTNNTDDSFSHHL